MSSERTRVSVCHFGVPFKKMVAICEKNNIKPLLSHDGTVYSWIESIVDSGFDDDYNVTTDTTWYCDMFERHLWYKYWEDKLTAKAEEEVELENC